MPVGFPLKTTYANGDVYSASDVNDTNGTINLLTNSTLSRSGGKNAIINSALDFWQRGTSIAQAASTAAYTADRWYLVTNANQASVISRQLTSDTTNLPNIQYCARVQRNSGQTGTANITLNYSMETADSLPFAGRTITVSFYARRGSNYSATSNALSAVIASGTGTDQNIAAGYTGSSTVATSTVTLTTTWQRFTFSGTVGSTATELGLYFAFGPVGTAGANDFFEITGVQLELGSTATTFGRAGSTIQQELSLCQRYYSRYMPPSASGYGPVIPNGYFASATLFIGFVQVTTTMRTTPTSIDYSTLQAVDNFSGVYTVTAVAASFSSENILGINVTIAGAGATRTGYIRQNNSTAGYLAFSAEL